MAFLVFAEANIKICKCPTIFGGHISFKSRPAIKKGCQMLEITENDGRADFRSS
jgi:hypothetical protein